VRFRHRSGSLQGRYRTNGKRGETGRRGSTVRTARACWRGRSKRRGWRVPAPKPVLARKQVWPLKLPGIRIRTASQAAIISTGMAAFDDKSTTNSRLISICAIVGLLCTPSLAPGQTATSIKDVRSIYVESLGSYPGAEDLRGQL